MSSTPSTRLAAVLIAVGGLAFARLLLMPTPIKDTLDMEVAKGLIQLLLVAVVGVTLSVLVFEYQRSRQLVDKAAEQSREVNAQRSAIVKDLIARAVESYSAVKGDRRMMRARGLGPIQIDQVVKVEPYELCMEAISDAQLRVEAIRRDVQTAKSLFSQPDQLVAHLRQMDAYLSSLITEFEGSPSMGRSASGDLTL